MAAYMTCVVEPLLRALRPKSIVEIGPFDGRMTRLLLTFCSEHNAILHTVDPAPQFDFKTWEESHPSHFRFHAANSLVALPRIDCYEAVLIDGDHNWYTVSRELDLIEEASVRSEFFPLVFVHDAGWPYGRRDVYHDPALIPDANLNPHARKGMRMDREELQDDFGINPNLFNALESNTPRNGVLTAVEDFLGRSSISLDCLVIPGFHGLAVLTPEEMLRERQEIRQLLEGWRWRPEVTDYVERIETERVFFQIAHTDEYNLRQRERKTLDQYQQEKTAALTNTERERTRGMEELSEGPST